jgi:chromosome segregation ATPase
MKLEKLVIIALIIVLPMFLGACDSHDPVIGKIDSELKETKAALAETQSELKETKAALKKTQAALEKMQADVTDIENEKDALEDQLEETQAKLKSAQKAFTKLQQRTDACMKELETTQAERAAVLRKCDELQQQVQSLTKEKNAVIAKVVTASPADIPKLQEEIKKDPAAAKPLQNATLAAKLQEAESYISVGNWQAAERLLVEIRATDANYPGLDILNSRIQNLKSRLTGSTQIPQQ